MIVDKSLTELMEIDGASIRARLRLLGFTQIDAEQLVACRSAIRARLNEIVDSFLAQLLTNDDCANLVGDAETQARLKEAIGRYLTQLFGGTYDELYVVSRLVMGKAHERIGVEPRFYLSAVWRLQSILEQELRRCSSDAEYPLRVQALGKILSFDSQLVIDTYIHILLTSLRRANERLQAESLEMEQSLAQKNQELEQLMGVDSVTGLSSSAAFHSRLRLEMSRAWRSGEALTLVSITLNGIQALVETEGQAARSAVLSAMGATLLRTFRETDFACRLGDEVFCIIMPKARQHQAVEVCRRLIQNFKELVTRKEVSFSTGIAQADRHEWLDSEELIAKAKVAMDAAKDHARRAPGFYIHKATMVGLNDEVL